MAIGLQSNMYVPVTIKISVIWYLCRCPSDRSLRQDRSPLPPGDSKKQQRQQSLVSDVMFWLFILELCWLISITTSGLGTVKACGSVSDGRAADREAGDINVVCRNVFHSLINKIYFKEIKQIQEVEGCGKTPKIQYVQFNNPVLRGASEDNRIPLLLHISTLSIMWEHNKTQTARRVRTNKINHGLSYRTGQWVAL